MDKLHTTDLLPALKPCPFCGETPTLDKHFREDVWRLTHRCPAVGPITFDWTTPGSIAKGWNRRAWSDQPNTTVKPRPITPALLKEFMQWTREAPMFLTSPQGQAFAEELRVVFELAEVGNDFLERCADAP